MHRFLIVLACLTLTSAPAAAQSGSILQDSSRAAVRSKTATVVAGAEYEASWLKQLFLGAHWRNLWTTPVQAEVLDLRTFAGGLVPTERGGGSQSKSLRFKGADGKEYKLRSLDKSANLTLLPKDLQESVAADVLQDQVCTSNPLSVLVAAPLVRAAGILSAQPQVVVIADSAGLGAFPEFWNMPATLEQNPTAEKDDNNSFGGADKISSSYKFFDKLDEDNDNRVQTTDFLKARLIDLFIGDWDRHID
ncbi:MAG: hypothetical protein IAF08_04640, partial [Rhizobacter sp.]|nr:hypothetical protein [Chlorobiales bacterium]